METVVIIVFLFALARWTVSLVNLLLNPRLRTGNTNHHPLISILIPARNEESNLPVLMDSLLRQSYERYEVLIYDDESTDRTWEIIESYAEKDPRISGIKGSALPPGWLGKNHACHQLSLKAAGAYFLFLDADLCLHDDALTKAVFTIGHYHLDLLSVFPSQRMTSWGEKLTVPLMNWILLSMLPLVLVRKSKRNSLAAANGQFMMFPASSYRPNLWHQELRSHQVEDIMICRKMKARGFHVGVFTGNKDIHCRMYHSLREGILGFSKNANHFFGGSYVVMSLFTLVVISTPILLISGHRTGLFFLYLALVVSQRIIISLASKQKPIQNVIFHPVQMFAWFLITCLALVNRVTGTYRWKGRNIVIES